MKRGDVFLLTLNGLHRIDDAGEYHSPNIAYMGSSGGGTTTTVQNSTPWNASQLADVQNGAIDARQNNPINYTPYQTYALPTQTTRDALTQPQTYYQQAGDATAPLVSGTQTTGINTVNDLAGGTGKTGGWNSSLAGLGSFNPASTDIQNLRWGSPTNQLNSNAAGTGPGGQSLTDTASGKFLGSNPYLNSMYQAAADPLATTYQTATSPNTDSSMEAAGRYNSGANSNATLNNETAFGKSLADLSAGIYGPAYTAERTNMVNAGNDLGTLSNSAANSANNAFSNAGTLNVTGTNAQAGALNSASTNALSAANAVPAQTAMPNVDYGNVYNAGTNLQSLDQSNINDLNNRFYGNEYSPWTTLSQEGGLIGSSIPGTVSSTSPYSTNTGGSVLGGIGSGLGVANGLNTLTSGSGLLSASSLAAK